MMLRKLLISGVMRAARDSVLDGPLAVMEMMRMKARTRMIMVRFAVLRMVLV
jgi:hypothetical protein